MITRTIVAAVLVPLFAPPALASDPDTAGMKRIFDEMKRGIESKNEALFKRQWHAVGYKTNLVGGSGLPGKSVYRQGSRKRWFLKPQMNKLRSLPGRRGGPWIIPCDIWSWKKKQRVDLIHALLIYEKRWLMLGGGERLREVEALGKRYVSKKPLKPKPKPKPKP